MAKGKTCFGCGTAQNYLRYEGLDGEPLCAGCFHSALCVLGLTKQDWSMKLGGKLPVSKWRANTVISSAP